AAYPVHSQVTPKPFRPFIVHSVMSWVQADSPYLGTKNFSRAVRANGSYTVIWRNDVGGKPQIERDIHDFETGQYTIVEELTKSTAREHIHPDEYKHRITPAVSCDGAPAGQILGLNVNYIEKRQKTSTTIRKARLANCSRNGLFLNWAASSCK